MKTKIGRLDRIKRQLMLNINSLRQGKMDYNSYSMRLSELFEEAVEITAHDYYERGQKQMNIFDISKVIPISYREAVADACVFLGHYEEIFKRQAQGELKDYRGINNKRLERVTFLIQRLKTLFDLHEKSK